MQLQDYIREHTKELTDNIQYIEKDILRLQTEKDANSIRLKQFHETYASLQEKKVDKRNNVEVLQSQSIEIENTIRTLEIQLEEKRRLIAELQHEIEDVQGIISDNKKNEKSARNESEQVEYELSRSKEKLEEYIKRRLELRRAAFIKYLSDMWDKLFDLTLSQETLKEKLEQRDLFEKARHSDPEIATLWEAREGWIKIIESPAPALVKSTAKNELERIENDLNNRYPGALDLKISKQCPEEIEEIFFSSYGDGDTVNIYLPIDKKQVEGIANIPVTRDADLSMHILWGFIKELSLNVDNAHVSLEDGCCVIETQIQQEEIESKGFVNIPVFGCQISFLLSPFPHELLEALYYEDTN